MPRKIITAVLLLLSLLAAAQQSDFSKMSSMVRRLSAHHPTPNTQQATVFISIDEQTFTPEVIEDLGGRILAREGDIIIATVPLSSFGRLSLQASVRRIEASRPQSQALMDTVPRIVNALPSYTATDKHPAFSGSGVVLGLMDVGFDLTHPTFFSHGGSGECRIKVFWDQLSPDTVGSSLPVGRDYVTADAIAAKGCSTNGRTQTHGTHTLGTAAGSGFNGKYPGIAPGSDICLVCNAVTSDTIYIRPEDYYKYTTATDALGFKYLFDYADRVGKPCVASFSEGYTFTDSDDDQLFATFLDRLNKPGHIIVVAAGNEGDALTYSEKPLGKATGGAFVKCYSRAAAYRIHSSGSTTLRLASYGAAYHDGQPTSEIAFSSSDGRLDSLLCDTMFVGSDTCAVVVSRHQAVSTGGDMYIMEIYANRPISQLGTIALTAEGSDSHVRMLGKPSFAFSTADAAGNTPDWCNATSSHNILAPATFGSVITVGNTTHRTGFVNSSGNYRQLPQHYVSGVLCPASSRGPTLDGRQKPDVVAPGTFVVSSYSSYFIEANPTDRDTAYFKEVFVHNGRKYAWHANSGTSMSCPVVAGTIALWLEADPTLTRDDVMATISRTCTHPDPSLTYPNNSYGYGQIDTYRGLLDVLGIGDIEGISQHQASETDLRLAGRRLHVTLSEQAHALQGRQPMRIRIFDTSGRLLEEHSVVAADREFDVSLRSVPAGLFVVQINGNSPAATGSQIFRSAE